MLIVGIALFATGTVGFKTSTTADNGQTNGNEQSNEENIYGADEYVTLEDFKVNDTITIKKVKLNHLDDNVTKDFYSDQEKILNNLHVGSEQYNAEHKLKYFINDNILSILYMVEETDNIGTCATSKAVTNIDLKNNKVLSEEELLSKANTSYLKIVENNYDSELKRITDSGNTDIEGVYGISYEDFKNNKQKYIDKGMEKVSNIIYTYVENSKIKYDYYTIKMDTMFHQVGKGGCFTWNTVELGDYK